MKRLALRYLYFVLGVAVNSFGIAFITKSALGTSQISSVPYVLSLQFPGISFGMCTFLFNLLFILLQVLLLKRDFHPVQFLQILVNLLFSGLIDLSMGALSFFQPQALWLRLLSLGIGREPRRAPAGAGGHHPPPERDYPLAGGGLKPHHAAGL